MSKLVKTCAKCAHKGLPIDFMGRASRSLTDNEIEDFVCNALAVETPHLIHGRTIVSGAERCSTMRERNGECGIKGKLWVPLEGALTLQEQAQLARERASWWRKLCWRTNA